MTSKIFAPQEIMIESIIKGLVLT